MKCLDCGEDKVLRLYEDTRTPPLDEEPCICRDCKIAALAQCIEELEEAAQAYKTELEELTEL